MALLSNKLVLLFVISCGLLSLSSQNAEGQQLPGIRWGRDFQNDDVTREEYKGKLWRLIKRRFNQHELNSKSNAFNQ